MIPTSLPMQISPLFSLALSFLCISANAGFFGKVILFESRKKLWLDENSLYPIVSVRADCLESDESWFWEVNTGRRSKCVLRVHEDFRHTLHISQDREDLRNHVVVLTSWL